MANPTRYKRGYSFSSFQANAPRTPLPGPRVDDELSNIELSLGTTIDALGDIRRPDGKLKNGIVTPESLAGDLNFVASAAAAAESAAAALASEEAAEAALGGISAYGPYGILAAEVLGADGDTAIPIAIAQAGLTGKEIDLNGETWSMTAIPANHAGVPTRRGKVLVPSLISGASTQLNSYAPDANGLMIGRENLAVFRKLVTLGTTRIFVYGDSTVELGPGWPVKTETLIKWACNDAGVNVASVTNRGAGGTSWSDLDCLGDLAVGTYLIIIKYGINDAVKANALQTFITDARAKLAQIRSSPHGSVDEVSILLLGPNATYNPSYGQDAKWFEDLRNVYVQLCRDFDCAYFDSYAYMQDAKNAPGIWMDNFGTIDPAREGEGLHPDQFAVHWYYRAAIKDFVLGDGGWNTTKSNSFWNLAYGNDPPDHALQPVTYPRGVVIQSVSGEAGFPFNGILTTTRQYDGSTVQTLHTLDVVPRVARRTGSDFIWTAWTGAPRLVSTFFNGWANKGGGHGTFGYQLQSDGMIELFGTISGGSNGHFATIPYTLAAAHTFHCANNSVVTLFPTGELHITSADNSLVCLNGVRARALDSF